MALPIAGGFLAALGGMLLNMLSTRIGYILAGLGIGIATYVGLTTTAVLVIDQLEAALLGIGSQMYQTVPWGSILLNIAAKAGFFDALNIIVAAYLAKAGLAGSVVAIRRLLD